MLLEATVLIRRTPEEVWAYLGDISNVSQWDQGVAGTRTTSLVSPGVGFEFDTLARSPKTAHREDWGKMSYRIEEADPVRGCTVKLTSSSGNARYFKRAEWRFRVDQARDGSNVYCAACFTLRFRYAILAPVVYCMKKGIQRDLESLKRVLEGG
jgi:hypothetical protein